MKHTLIDPSQLELEERVVSIKRVTKVVKCAVANVNPDNQRSSLR